MDSKKALFDRMALSCISYLETFETCQLSDLKFGDGALTHELLMWEKKNIPFRLPRDLRNFYSVFNGFNVTWNVTVVDKIIPVGEMQVNKIELLQKAPIEGFFMSNCWKDIAIASPDSKTCAVFLLQPVSDVGEVYLLYRQPQSTGKQSATENEYIGLINQSGLYENPEIWLLDNSQRWHFMTQTFTQYFRLMVTHLGVCGWQLAFTSEGLPQTTRHWMSMYCKERLIIDLQWHEKLNNGHNALLKNKDVK